MKLHTVAMLLTGLIVISCKKSGNNPTDQDPDKDCKVVKYRCESRNETWRIVYNGSGRMDSILIGDALNVEEIRTFSYNPQQNKLVVKRHYMGTPGEESHVDMDALGKIMSILDHGSGLDWKQMTFHYSSDKMALLERGVLSFSGTTSTFNELYTWNIVDNPLAINMTKHGTNSGVYDYIYYHDKPTQAGDYLNFEKIIASYDRYYRPFSSTNLLKSIKMDGDPLVDVDYTFNDKGLITRFAVRYDGDTEPEIWDLTYQCK
jgi:hypothetical protein